MSASRGYILPSNLEVAVTRDYGATASSRSRTNCSGTCSFAVVSVSVLI